MNRNLFLVLILVINSCSYPEILFDELIYTNNFEENTKNIDGGNIVSFNNTKVLGNYNNDGFYVHLDEIKDHDYIFISFDLYIHGSWDGNTNGFDVDDRPDKWIIEIDPEMDLHSDKSNSKFETTFSNSVCFSNYCLMQSYPNPFPSNNNPTLGSSEINLAKICDNSFFGGNTTLYKIEKGFRHKGKSVILKFYDELYQPNAIDKDGIPQQKCDESWSLDNLDIRIVKYQ